MNLRIKSQSGQSLIEATLAINLLAIPLFVAVMFIAHITYLKIISRHQLYEYLVCMETKFLEHLCEHKMRTQLESQMMIGNIKSFFHQKSISQSTAELTFTTWYKIEIKTKESIALPFHYAQPK